MEKKSNKGFIITIVILSILLLGAVGYIAYDKLYLNDEKEPLKEEQKTEEKVSDTTIKQLHDSIIADKVHGNTWGFYYDEKLTIDSISSELLVKYALMHYVNEEHIIVNNNQRFDTRKCHYYYEDYESGEKTIVEEEEVSSQIIPKKEIDNYIKEKFNYHKEIKLENEFTTALGYLFGYFAHYNEKTDSFYLYVLHRGGAFYGIENKFIEAKQDKDFLYIYDKVIVCGHDEGGSGCESSFLLDRDKTAPIILTYQNNEKYYDKNHKEIKTDKKYIEDWSWNSEAIFEDFDNEINTFKHTFKKAENGNYYWYSSEIVN